MRKETFSDITDLARSRGANIRPGTRLIIASGGNYANNRRYNGYNAGWNTLKLYPADKYTYSVTARPFCISRDLIEVSKPIAHTAPDPAEVARKAEAAEVRRLKEERCQAMERARAEQLGIFEGGTAYEEV